MAERKPLVLISGEISQLPVGDTLPGSGDFLSCIDEILGSESFEIPARRQMIVQDQLMMHTTSELIVKGTLVVKGA
jgi:hypothetical protein